MPWGRHWLIGTTDTDYSGPRSEPQVDEADVEYLLAEANKWFAKPLTRDDVVGVYSGLRPLLSAGTQEDGTATLSREHAVLRPAPGLVLIAGGKYTTYRVMAADAVDAAVTSRAEVVTDSVPPSKTDELPLVGAAGYAAAWATRERTAREAGLSLAAVEHLLRRHGDRARTVLDLIASDPKLAEPMHPDSPYLFAEGVVAVTREGALGLDDVLVRRTRLALETRGGGVDVAESVARVLHPTQTGMKPTLPNKSRSSHCAETPCSRFRAGKSTSKLWPWTTPNFHRQRRSGTARRGGICHWAAGRGPKRLGCCRDGTCRPTSFHASHQRPA